jgi:ribonuclease HII
VAPLPNASRRDALRRRERELRAEGLLHVAGTDEVGVGPLAGPLVAAAVILPPGARLPGVDDSKKLTPLQREHWAGRVRACAIAFAVHEVPAARVDEIGPYHAALAAMSAAVNALVPAAQYVLVDARRLPGLACRQEAIVGGDGRHLCIAAASLLAKVHRDALLSALDGRYPGYGFAGHKGYATASHLEALARLGPCPEHRRRYAPVRAASGLQPALF